MGREARANPRTARKDEITDGPHNPAPVRLMARLFDYQHPIVRRIRESGKAVRVTLAGTAYLVDRNGTYRRAPVEVDK